jgi:feruloyl-CoA synthase
MLAGMASRTPRLFAPPSTVMRRRGDGSLLLSPGTPLGPCPPTVAAMFRAAGADLERVLVAERRGDGWRTVSWAQARAAADAIGQSLLDREPGGRPVAVLAGNSVEHLLLMLGAHTVGVTVVPLSVAYSLQSSDHAKLRWLLEQVDPFLVLAGDTTAFGRAIELARATAEVVTPAGGAGTTPFEALTATAPGGEVERRLREQTPDTVAKILFTSGSTGQPKGVVTTNRMLCANQRMLRQVWPFLEEEPPVLLDWLPWSHTFGGNHNLNLVLANGGSLWIDDGRPAPGLLERTLRNLRQVRPTIQFNVPAGYAALVPELERDPELAERFFSRLRVIFFAAAALPQELWERIERLAARHGGTATMTTSWGASETAPAATSAHFASGRADCIGVPLPGVELKLAPVGDKLEIRVKGPNVMPGYHRRPDLDDEAFDDEGWYRSGDAVRLIDEREPDRGLRFDGRIAEDFKLSTGTWVSVGTLRPALLGACRGLLRDAVLTGRDTPWVGALGWLDAAAAARLAAGDDGAGPGTDPAAPARHPRVREALAAALGRLNRQGGSSRRVERLLLLDEPPSLDAGEITDKGYVNQRAVLDRRAAEVARLHAEPPAPEVVQAPPSR